MKTYIRSSACISPQKTLGDDGFLTDVVTHTGEPRLRAIEPDYRAFIDPKLIRRMSHIVRMGITAARECLQKGHTEMPGAIITGTAYGCLADTVSFLTNIIERNEELLPPTAFIQSTHNTVAAQIALMLHCHEYNNTFVHKGISFESALLDGIMLLKEKEADNILVGGTEEMTDTSFTVLKRLGLFKRTPVSSLSLFETASKGTIGGEGAAFFLLTDKPSSDNLCELAGLQTFYQPKEAAGIEEKIRAFLTSHALQIEDIDLVITGKNGDLKNDAIYHRLNDSLFQHTGRANYKHLCGEYPTSAAFALWLATGILKNGVVPQVVIENAPQKPAPKKILIYNHYLEAWHSLLLVASC